MKDKSRFFGGLLCLGILVCAVFFIWGVCLERFWRLAVTIPVAIGFLGLLALGFWVGWTIVTVKPETPTPKVEEKKEEVQAKKS